MPLPGYRALVRLGGTPLEVAGESCSLISGTTYQITSVARRTIDPLQAFLFKDGSSAISFDDITSVDHANGTVTLNTAPAGSVTFSGYIIPLIDSAQVLNGLNEFEIDDSTDNIDSTVIVEQQQKTRRRTSGLRDTSINVRGLMYGSQLQLLKDVMASNATTAVLQIQYTSDASTVFERHFTKVEKVTESVEISDIHSVSIDFKKTSFQKNNGLVYQEDTGTILWLDAQDYSGSGDWLDQSGFGNDCSWVGTAPTWDGESFTFDGVDDYGVITDDDSLDMPGDFTIEFWYKPTNGTKGLMGKAEWSSPQNETGFMISGDTYHKEGSSSYSHTFNNGPMNVWQHVMIVRSGTTVTSYRNSVLEFTFGFSDNAVYSNDEEMRIGRIFHLGSPNFFSDKIAVIRIWSSALDSTARTNVYNEFVARGL